MSFFSLGRLKTYGELVIFSHSVFSLSFALAAAFMASGGLPEIRTLFWVTVAFLGGRNCANALNRVVDRVQDGENPRTAGRHIPRGEVPVSEALALAGFFFLLLALGAFMLNPLCLYLLPAAGILFIAYSYTKRFTWLCHFVLGVTCAGASVGGWIGVTGRFEFPAFVLAAANALWVAGFDIVYAAQDAEFDRKHGLYSIPGVFGVPAALRIAGAVHGVTVGMLVLIGVLLRLHVPYWTGIALISGLLVWQHRMVTPDRLENVTFASYSVNQIISAVLFVAVVIDYLVF